MPAVYTIRTPPYTRVRAYVRIQYLSTGSIAVEALYVGPFHH